jgi:hypothetical protein
MIGQANYELEDKSAAREAFNEAAKFSDGRRAANGWISFLDSEIQGKVQFAIFEASVRLEGLQNEQKSCKQLEVLGQNLPEGCKTIEDRLKEGAATLAELKGEA